ncbi:Pseudoazurin precursor [Marinomonas gallaica]|uniref:Pseudoazurin n=1 Tax=Marinomonas gallaica TaxID=1806667 RepID=A0A1C3JTV2_9GAMM|nr:pseudoazurin [Marinomonas gallaica]SBT18516.1 Pseudoazurin precursor [Marinomonas gallaica]SBT22775.1 Pseudoazurin precursor [Marinomonas gallaica]
MLKPLLTVLGTSLIANTLYAAHYEVQMVNRNKLGAMSYEPSYLNIQPGDTVKFLRTAPGHNAATISSMWPEAAQTFRGNINEEIVMSFDKEGIYGVECTPHMAMGMVMVIQVGDKDLNAISAPQSLPQRAQKRIADIKQFYAQ